MVRACLHFQAVRLMFLCIAKPLAKTSEKFYKEDKDQNELTRQWKVLIEDIEVQN